MTNVEIANIILEQMGGGHKLNVMVGAQNFVATNKGLQFNFKGCRRTNKITISLDPSDTYTVQFWRITNRPVLHLVETYTDIYADNLIPLFEKFTGLYLTL